VSITDGIPIGENDFLDVTDAEARRHRDQMGLGTPVVYAVKDAY